jgi:hypothetical protein
MLILRDVLAMRCNTTSGGEVGLVINNQQDFDSNLAGCTTVSGRVWIGNKYQGALNMSGITSISDLTSNSNTTELTELHLDDVVYISSLILSYTPKLGRLAIPKLTTLGTAFIEPNSPLEVDFPSLVTVEEYLRLEGPIARYQTAPR